MMLMHALLLLILHSIVSIWLFDAVVNSHLSYKVYKYELAQVCPYPYDDLRTKNRC